MPPILRISSRIYNPTRMLPTPGVSKGGEALRNHLSHTTWDISPTIVVLIMSHWRGV